MRTALEICQITKRNDSYMTTKTKGARRLQEYGTIFTETAEIWKLHDDYSVESYYIRKSAHIIFHSLTDRILLTT